MSSRSQNARVWAIVPSVALAGFLCIFAAGIASPGGSDRPGVARKRSRCSWRVVRQQQAGLKLHGVAATSSRDVWFVGSDETPVIEHWDGKSWQSMRPLAMSGELNDVVALSPRDVWAVGSNRRGTIALHWNGVRWKLMPTPELRGESNEFLGVAATSSGDVWAVGDFGFVENQELPTALVEHWDGKRWHLSYGVFGRGEDTFHGVAAVSSRDVWAVGSEGHFGTNQLIKHWNGQRWQDISVPSFPDGPDDRPEDLIYAATAISARDVWAVGYAPFGAVTEHWDGRSWRDVSDPAYGALHSVAALSARDVWAVGGHFSGSDDSPLAEHWDGRRWGLVQSPRIAISLLDIAAVSPTDLWAVGGGSSLGAPDGVIEHYFCS
jgi:hypothetical protein